MAFTARMLEDEQADPLADLPGGFCLLPNGNDGADWLMAASDGCRGAVNALVDLVVGVTESGGGDLDQELIVFDLGHWDGLELVLLVVLRQTNWSNKLSLIHI